MGTRHLIAVKQNDQWKVAQYGQWDGYPSGQGVTILSFLKTSSLLKFGRLVKKLSFYSEDEVKAMETAKNYPTEMSRDTSADILPMIYKGEVKKLYNNIEFAGDSLFCEYAYVIDLDTNKFEVFKGFNKTPLTAKDRFFGFNKTDSEYQPVTLLKRYSLSKLPSEKRFLKECD